MLFFLTIFVYCTVIILICAATCSQMQQFFVFILILTFCLKIAVMRIDFLRKHEQLKKKTYSNSPFVCASWETVIVGWVGLSPDLDTRPRYCQLINYLCCMSLPTVFVSLFLPVLCIWTLLKGQCREISTPDLFSRKTNPLMGQRETGYKDFV